MLIAYCFALRLPHARGSGHLEERKNRDAVGRTDLHTVACALAQQGPTKLGRVGNTALRGVYLGRDVLAPVAALVTLPLVIIDWRLLGIPLAFGLLQTAVLIYNEVAFKGKAFVEALRVLPVCALYSACKTGSALATLVRIAFGAEADVRESKRRWLQQRHAIKG